MDEDAPTENGTHLIPPTMRYWPDEKTGPWVIYFMWQVIDGRAEVIGVEMTSTLAPFSLHNKFSAGDSRPQLGVPLTTGILRQLKFSELVAEQRAKQGAFLAQIVRQHEMAKTLTATPMRDATRRRLEMAAEAYQDAWRKGERPTRAVANRLGISDSAAAKIVARARKAGLLPATSPGVASGVTPS